MRRDVRTSPDEGLEGSSVHLPNPKTSTVPWPQFVSYEVGEPKYDQAECISKGLTYESRAHRIRVMMQTMRPSAYCPRYQGTGHLFRHLP